MVKTSKGEQSKTKLIECAAELFLQKGYNATGINDILSGTGLPKGSFYFHFASKKDLAINVSAYFEKKIGLWILQTSKEKKWTDFINQIVNKMIEEAENKKHFGCPFAVLGLEIAFSEPDISEYYNKSMKKLIDIFASVLKFSDVPENKIDILANRAFAIYEGYLLYYRISKDVNILRMMLRDLIAIYEESKSSKRNI
ncbi:MULTISPECIES: TetR/AcrR family transcriptional regulator [unclassified Clostridium]|uniref:TetR/AcrR family transcriptional regulator n=1 Tax=unclassified Clostridium TaxID=2614128 RepID=UPI000297F13B|nr:MULTISPECIES: TetR/AcrR family transcriptional regulator [unclassified Clostridium]EKQ58240.1 MAG: transcriptional regulator [Clostridium sp. Maddingley MBC34-26]